MSEKPWHEQDRFWIAMLPVIFRKEKLSQTAAEVDHILSLARPKKEACILDAGCGIGRHSLELAKRGFQVTALDRTTAYLKIAKSKARKKNLKIEFVEGDMRRFLRPAAFDYVFNLFTSFGYFNDKENLKVLCHFYKNLKPKGILVIEMASPRWLKKNFLQRTWHSLDGQYLLEERKLSKNRKRINTFWILLGKKQIEACFSHRLYNTSELKTMLKQCGFTSIQIQDKTRLLIVARK